MVKKILKNPERYSKAQVTKATAHQMEHQDKSDFCVCESCGKYHRNNFVCEERAEAMYEAMIPADVREEHRMLHNKHRVLPSGAVEYADEYGGY